MTPPPVALTIAGSDPSGGAGLQADLKTFERFNVYGQAVIALLTVQNTLNVSEVSLIDAALVTRQLDALSDDIPPHAAKTGALGSAENVQAVADWARRTGTPLVVDPVMISTSGARLLDEAAERALLSNLFPAARLVTPNLPEAARLSGLSIQNRDDMLTAAQRIYESGPGAVLIKGGHLPGDEAYDLLFDAEGVTELSAPRIGSRPVHGTGCALSAAITAGLASGRPLVESVQAAKEFLCEAIESAPALGHGAATLNWRR